GDSARTGFNQNETFLTPANVASSFGPVWQSPVLDGHLYASPLYQDGILIQGNGNAANHPGDGVQSASFQGKTIGVVFASTRGAGPPGGRRVAPLAARHPNGPPAAGRAPTPEKPPPATPPAATHANSAGGRGPPTTATPSTRLYVTGSVTDYLLPAGNPNHGA